MNQTANQKIKSGHDKWNRHVLRRWLNVQMTCVMEEYSRSWRRKLEKPVCRWWRGWTVVQQVGLEEANRSLCRDGTSVTWVLLDYFWF